MAIALRASCPSCKLQVEVKDEPTDGDLTTVTCKGCGKKFGLRFRNDNLPKSKPPAQVAAPVLDDPFANLNGALPDQMSSASVNWQDYRVRKPLIAGKPLAIAFGATAAIACLVAVVMFATKKAAEIDVNAIGDSLLKGPADTIQKIHRDWTRYADEQETLTASISHQSDCDKLMFPMERLEEKHLNLLIRGALLEQGSTASTEGVSLPTAPTTQPGEGKTFRAVEALLTTKFRAAESKLNQLSNAVLSYLHTALKPIVKSDNESENHSLTKILIKRSLCRVLAEAHRGADESKTAVAIYELTEELKKLKTADDPKPASTMPEDIQYAEYSATQMQLALAARFTKDAQSEIAKALTAFDQVY